MAVAAERIFKHDSLGRLKMIQMLHDFEDIRKHIDDLPNQTRESGVEIKLDATEEELDQLVWDAFFPKLRMSFSHQENPLDLQSALDRQIKALKIEILLVHQSMDIRKANRNQLEVMGGLLNRHLKQIDLESKLK